MKNQYRYAFSPFLDEPTDGAGGAGDGGTLLSGITAPGEGHGGEKTEVIAPGEVSSTSWIDEDGNFKEGWLDRPAFESVKDHKASLAKFKGTPDLAKSYISLEQRLGKKATEVYIPGPDAKPEEMAAFRAKIGVPETPEAYKIAPEKLPEGVTWNDELAKPFTAIAHKYNIPEAAMKELAAAQVSQEALRFTETGRLLEAELKQGEETLKKEFGENYQKNMMVASNAIKSVGGSINTPGLRDPGVVTIIQRLAAQLGDDKFINGDVSPSLQPGKVKADDIVNNKANPYYERYWSGDKEINKMVRDLYRESAR